MLRIVINLKTTGNMYMCIPYKPQFYYIKKKHAYSNILKILQPKKENFQIKNSDIFHISDQNIDCGEAVLMSTHNLCFFLAK